ncbi:MAG: mechanosensitive ion channel family protein [Flavobacteriales bacterium]|jgi:miniconductance mechanosensitive channel|nr:mechanosensitive ion channel family protein [Flavobacteriales bacterium]
MALTDSLSNVHPTLKDSLSNVNTVKNKLPFEKEEFIGLINNTLSEWGLQGDALIYVRTGILLLGVVLISFILWWASRKILIQIIYVFAARSKTKWDDYLVENRFFAALAHLVPLIYMDNFVRMVFYSFPGLAEFFQKVVVLAIIYVVMLVVIRFFNTARDVLREKPDLKDKPIESYFQLGKIVVVGVLVVVMISVAVGVDVSDVFISLGAGTAVLLLVFRDTILGFVGSIQLAANDMIRIGDWVTMEKYGADGDVLEINLTTVKVQNFDKTITTIPTYSFISDSFKNWRGMAESDGRRLVRAINIKIESIKYCTPEMLNKFGEIELIREYVESKESEIEEYNKGKDINKDVLLNGRNQTNVGIFRHYVTQVLKNNTEINDEMTLMVRQLAPTETGVPIQVYTFTKTHDWPKYEAITADLFDHLLAAVPYFELEVFEAPAGSDMRALGSSK